MTLSDEVEEPSEQEFLHLHAFVIFPQCFGKEGGRVLCHATPTSDWILAKDLQERQYLKH